ncbi:glycosyl transferase family group 2-domain-containing protein [Microdochium trichocladiopsis]|uniref:Glycosyl transferase family group 2-domain-containing protein n=1 Tax=Microdochium trichocladiopsis TaxID=1682393 RepID=A0A9P8Y755_9PEZI|nr:glycosyl transferase family group 2-domain-containing protein [Microdochium trichocladiopsis]KAH7033405.1 glycosyl transferase family group 2-domain-containing protein [Microdochium trichocladiopsis]
MVSYLYGRITASRWLPLQLPENEAKGLLLRQSRGTYVTEPERIDPLLLAAVQKMNAEVAFTMTTETMNVIFSTLSPDQCEIILENGSQLQVVESLAAIAAGSANLRFFQYAALLREERVLLIWHDDLDRVLKQAAEMEHKLLSLIWRAARPMSIVPSPLNSVPASGITSPVASTYNLAAELKKTPVAHTIQETPFVDEEKGHTGAESLQRPVVVTSTLYVGLGVAALTIILVGSSVSEMVAASLVDGNYMRFALIAAMPFIMSLALFFTTVVFGSLFQALGPVGTCKSNTRYHSTIKPNVTRAYAAGFSPPPITIQMPVYKESLAQTIKPTVESLKAAISHYESHGGTATIFINDDGIQLISEEDATARREFYLDNNIGWVGRPGHNSKPWGEDGPTFTRGGKFKKASNMNFALNFSNKVEDAMQTLVDERAQRVGHDMLDQFEHDELYEIAMQKALEQEKIAWAAGNIRMGEHILIVDSDTRVPVDCLLYGAAEMFFSPEVAIVQHSTGVMKVVGDYFENGIAFFTDLIYSAIRYAASSGEVAPFVGHNAFLRWKAIQAVGTTNQETGFVTYWSESHVSEDFEISLKVQTNGNVVRLASYHGDGFKEGVSLTIYDELARWEKYSFGCNELMFNPMRSWITKGPFTKIFRTFIWADMPLTSKITIFGYIASYYSIASSLPLTILNYFLVGWFVDDLDKFYLQSFNVLLSIVFVFNGLGTVCRAILFYRTGEKPFVRALIEELTWTPMFVVFFGSLSFHLNLSILAHMFSIDMQWGATAKEKENSNFFKEVPKIFSTFKWMYVACVPIIGAMIYLGCFAPYGYEINTLAAVLPLALAIGSHMLMPFLLNPSLMVFNY